MSRATTIQPHFELHHTRHRDIGYRICDTNTVGSIITVSGTPLAKRAYCDVHSVIRELISNALSAEYRLIGAIIGYTYVGKVLKEWQGRTKTSE